MERREVHIGHLLNTGAVKDCNREDAIKTGSKGNGTGWSGTVVSFTFFRPQFSFTNFRERSVPLSSPCSFQSLCHGLQFHLWPSPAETKMSFYHPSMTTPPCSNASLCSSRAPTWLRVTAQQLHSNCAGDPAGHHQFVASCGDSDGHRPVVHCHVRVEFLCAPLHSTVANAMSKSTFTGTNQRLDTFVAGHSMGSVCGNNLVYG